MFFERGNELEERFLAEASARARSVADLRNVRPNDRVAATVHCIENGVDLIIQPKFVVNSPPNISLPITLVGEADALVRCRGTQDVSYTLVEVKSSKIIKDHHRAQAAFYGLLYEATTGNRPDETVIVTWQTNSEGELNAVENVVDVSKESQEIATFLRDELTDHATNDDADFHVNTRCDTCPYRRHCTKRAELEQHLSYLPGIRRRTRHELMSVGVRTWPELATPRSDYERLRAKFPGNSYVLDNLRQQALSLSYANYFRRSSLREHLGVNRTNILGERVEAPGSERFTGARVYLDLESNPVDGGDTYLFGYVVEQVRRTASHLSLVWDRDKSDEILMNDVEAFTSPWGALQPPVQRMAGGATERELFANFLDEVDELREAYRRLVIFHYGAFDTSHIRKLGASYGDIPNVKERVEALLSESIDLLRAVKDTRVLPITSYSLKYVAPVLTRISDGKHGHEWKGPSTGAQLAEFMRSFAQTPQARSIGLPAPDPRVIGRSIRAVERVARRMRTSVEDVLAPSAGGSVLWHREHLERPHEPIWPMLLSTYNYDDLLAARAVAHWLIDEYRTEQDEGGREKKALDN